MPEAPKIKKGGLWMSNIEKARYPRDAYKVYKVSKSGKVEFFREGGGFGYSLPEDEFRAQFRLPTEFEIEAAKEPTPAYFDMDDCPVYLGFTYGRRWNGWGVPLVEKESFKKYLTQMWDAGDFDHEFSNLHFEGDKLIYHDPESGIHDLPVDEEIELTTFIYKGARYTGFFVDIGWCWNQYDIDDLDAMLLDELKDAIVPDCLEELHTKQQLLCLNN